MIFLICLIATTTSCNDMDKIHQQYLDGEIIYSGKLDTLLIRPGIYRAQLEAYTHLLGNSNKVIVEFDNRTEIYDIESDVPEIYSVIIENLDENNNDYLFKNENFIGGVFIALSGISWGFGYLGQPHLLIRFMAIKSSKDIRLARRIAIAWAFPAIIGAFFATTAGTMVGYLYYPWAYASSSGHYAMVVLTVVEAIGYLFCVKDAEEGSTKKSNGQIAAALAGTTAVMLYVAMYLSLIHI